MQPIRQLTLARKRDELLHLTNRATGEIIATVQVVEIRPGKVRLRLFAPDSVRINRAEITDPPRAA